MATNLVFYLFIDPSALCLTLYTHLHPIVLLSFGKTTNSQVTLASNATISSSMALSHLRFPTAYSKEMGSTSHKLSPCRCNDKLQSHHMWIFCSKYLIHVDLCTPLLLSSVFKTLLAIWALGVTTKMTFDFSSTLFFESFDTPSTWNFLNDVWKLPCIMLKILIFLSMECYWTH